jgi:hypothetical protein
MSSSQGRWGFSGFNSPYAGYSGMGYYPAMGGYYPSSFAQTNYQAQPAADPSDNKLRISPNALPRPSGLTAKDTSDAPAGPLVRMRYIELSVSGVEDAGDSAKLTTTLDKLKGSRGASVKRKAGGEATVKVWYSDKEPLAEAEVIEAVSKLGFKAAVGS